MLERTTELSDAGGPARPHWQLTRPARLRSSGFVELSRCAAGFGIAVLDLGVYDEHGALQGG